MAKQCQLEREVQRETCCRLESVGMRTSLYLSKFMVCILLEKCIEYTVLELPYTAPQEDEEIETACPEHQCPVVLIGVSLGKGLCGPTNLRNTGASKEIKNSLPDLLKPLKC